MIGARSSRQRPCFELGDVGDGRAHSPAAVRRRARRSTPAMIAGSMSSSAVASGAPLRFALVCMTGKVHRRERLDRAARQLRHAQAELLGRVGAGRREAPLVVGDDQRVRAREAVPRPDCACLRIEVVARAASRRSTREEHHRRGLLRRDGPSVRRCARRPRRRRGRRRCRRACRSGRSRRRRLRSCRERLRRRSRVRLIARPIVGFSR